MRLEQLSHQSTRAATGCAIALGFSIPVSVAADNILLALVLLFWLGGGDFRQKLVTLAGNRVAHAAFFLFALLVAGVTWADDFAAGVKMLGKYIDLLFVPVLISLFRDKNNRRRASAALIAALLLTIVVSGLIAFDRVPNGFPILNEPTQPYQVFKKYLTQSILLACGAFLFALLARDAPTSKKRLLWAVAAAGALINVVVLLGGRSGYITLAVLALLFVYTIWRGRGLAWLAAMLMVASIGIISGHAPTNNRLGKVVQEFSEWHPGHEVDIVSGDPLSTSTGQRMNYAFFSVAIVSDHLISGVGTGGFASAFAHQVEKTTTQATVNPHNEYLNLAVQLGIPGAIALIALFTIVWRHARALPTALERDLARGLALTFAVGCLFNSLLMDHVEGLFFAWCLGVLFGGYDPARMRAGGVTT